MSNCNNCGDFKIYDDCCQENFTTDLNGREISFTTEWIQITNSNDAKTMITIEGVVSPTVIPGIFTISGNYQGTENWGTYVFNGIEVIILKDDILQAEIIIGRKGMRSLSLQFGSTLGGIFIQLPTLTYLLDDNGSNTWKGFITNAGDFVDNGDKFLINGIGNLILK
tara:strand:- start:19 stop:519 length:501 start_codon:yes stop_codon:yes gene_type:complete